MDTKGIHAIAELWECNPTKLADKKYIKKALEEAAIKAQAKIVKTFIYHYKPGIAAITLVKESHISIHTWPEHGYAAIDSYTCGKTQPVKAINHLKKALECKKCKKKVLERGTPNSLKTVKK